MKIAGKDRYKTVSLKTTDLHDARDKAYDLDAELRFKIKHELPIFNRLFSQVAKEYIDLQKQRSEVGQITHHRWRVLDSHVRSEARNLVWKDVSVQTYKQGRQFVRLNVRGEGKHRNLVAAENVAAYFDRIKEISKATGLNDSAFSNDEGTSAKTLYVSLIESLLTESGLLMSSSGKRRSTYCFRHTYARFRLFGTIPENIRYYLDLDAIARDLAMDYSETTIAGKNYIFRCA